VQAGDLIKTVDGHPVTSFADLIEILKTKRPWDSLRATLERDGSSIEVASLLVPRPQRKSPQKLSQPPARPRGPQRHPESAIVGSSSPGTGQTILVVVDDREILSLATSRSPRHSG